MTSWCQVRVLRLVCFGVVECWLYVRSPWLPVSSISRLHHDKIHDTSADHSSLTPMPTLAFRIVGGTIVIAAKESKSTEFVPGMHNVACFLSSFECCRYWRYLCLSSSRDGTSMSSSCNFDRSLLVECLRRRCRSIVKESKVRYA